LTSNDLRGTSPHPSAGEFACRTDPKPDLMRPWPMQEHDMEEETKAVENVAAAELRQLIERIERLEEEKASISDDIKDVYGEAKGRGYDTKAMRTIVRLRKKDANERIEEETILQTYMAALGME
jgi:uncharacterized protein (UPF0335 family)